MFYFPQLFQVSIARRAVLTRSAYCWSQVAAQVFNAIEIQHFSPLVNFFLLCNAVIFYSSSIFVLCLSFLFCHI